MTSTNLDLNGHWRLGWRDDVRVMSVAPTHPEGDDDLYIDAIVPGEVHADLVRAGIIDEPSLGMNALKARWVEECMWWYRRSFQLPADAELSRAWLNFEQLDLDAQVFLNGKRVGRHRNSFRPFRAEVSDFLVAGENHIAVEINSGLFRSNLALSLEDLGGLDDLPDTGQLDFERRAEKSQSDWNRMKREWLRKPAYQSGWDFTSRFLTVGISGGASIELRKGGVNVRSVTPLVEVSEGLDSATVTARVVIEGLDADPVSARIHASVAGVEAEVEIEVPPGESTHELALGVDRPELWWPAGHGQQKLYDLSVKLHADKADDSRTIPIGFRRVELNQDPHPEEGRYFILVVNNKPIFCKGANMAPLDLIPSRVEPEKYDGLLKLAREANFNFLRVNGVGMYETDTFYTLCDRLGIMVMQDFTLSISRYPAGDQWFLDEIRAEATHQIRRLAPHPSLVMWCGSNENEWHYWDHDRERLSDLPDGHLYRFTLPEILEREDPTRLYIPSSPYSPDGMFPNADDRGDQHPWTVGFPGDWDIRDYRKMSCRFADEGGILGPPSLPTIEACLPAEERRMDSISWFVHDNAIGGRRPSGSNEMLEQLTGLNVGAMSVEEYAYWGGLIQGEGLREYAENFRWRMFDSASACTWSFNDCWPTTRGWSIVDFYNRRTPAFWAVKRSLAPVHVIVTRNGESVDVYGVNDTTENVEGELLSGFFRMDGAGDQQSAEVTLTPNSSTLLSSHRGWSDDPTESIAFAALRRPGHIDVRSRLILPKFSELDWAKPELNIEHDGTHAVFSSDRFVWGVCLDLSGERPLADNFFDVWPGIPYRISWEGSDAPEVLRVGNLAGAISTARSLPASADISGAGG